MYGGWLEQGYLSGQILDNVAVLDDDGRVVPWLAESWTVAPDGLAWTFRLRRGPTSSGGTPVDAAAVAADFEYWSAGGNSTVQAWTGGYIDAARALDDRTVAVTGYRTHASLGIRPDGTRGCPTTPRCATSRTTAAAGTSTGCARRTRTASRSWPTSPTGA